MDEVKIFNYALTPEEVQDLFRSNCHKSDTNQDGCVDKPELMAFIARWKVSSQDVPMRELIEAIGLHLSGVGCAG